MRPIAERTAQVTPAAVVVVAQDAFPSPGETLKNRAWIAVASTLTRNHVFKETPDVRKVTTGTNFFALLREAIALFDLFFAAEIWPALNLTPCSAALCTFP